MESWKEHPVVLVHGTTTWRDIPTLLKTDILSRLPVKTLIRSTAVCKSWYTNIKKPTFISKHINRTIKNGPIDYFLFAPVSSHTFTLITKDQQTKVELPFRTESRSVNITGPSCDGLLCLVDASPFLFGRDLYLWNPSLNKHKLIPTKSSRFVKDIKDWIRTYPVIGFGYSKTHDDYRIVRIVYSADTTFNFFGNVKPKVEVYSLRTDSWKKVNVGATIKCMASNERWTFVNGIVYWLEAKKDHPIKWILSFDFNNEAFGEVEVPRNFMDGVGKNANAFVTDYKGLLGLCVYGVSSDYEVNQRLSVWVRQDNGKRMVWLKQVKVVLKDRLGWPLKFTKKGVLILEAMENLEPTGGRDGGIPDLTRLVSYDLKKLRFKDIENNGPYTVDTSFMESLILFEEQKPRFRTASLLQ